MNISKFSSLRKLALSAALVSAGVMGSTAANATASATASIQSITIKVTDLDSADGVAANASFAAFTLFGTSVAAFSLGGGANYTQTINAPYASSTANWNDVLNSVSAYFSATSNTQVEFVLDYKLTATTQNAGEESLIQLGMSVKSPTGLPSADPGQAFAEGVGGLDVDGVNDPLRVTFKNLTSRTVSNVALSIYGNSSGTSVSPVPEPESYAMFLAGLAAMGAVARRRRVK